MKKQLKLFIILLLVFTCTGCTQYIKEDNKTLVYESTGQTLASNILCKPVDEDVKNFYLDHEDSMSVKLEDLPECSEFKPSDLSYKSLWESIFIKPIAWLILKFGELFGNFGLSVMFMSLLIRAIMIPLTKKSMSQSESMKQAQPELEKIERKYRNKDDNESMMAKSQEMMMVYKKNKINPISSCLTALIQLPLFFAFLEAINRVPAIFEGTFLNMNLGMTPIVGLKQGNYMFLLVIIIILVSTYFTFKISMSSQAVGDQAKQMQSMMVIMIIMMAMASINLPTAIALYWIINNLFAIVQSLIMQKRSEGK
jgi:YidC/Oxa1 family membrane protein insertase